MDVLTQSREKQQKVKEMELLFEIYQRQTLSIEQIRKLFYANSKGYVYRKIAILKQKGWIKAEGRISYGKDQQSSPVILTKEGIQALVLKGYVQQPRQWNKNIPSNARRKMVLDFNEIFSELRPYGYTIIDSRTWKELGFIKRTHYCIGGLITPDGDKYTVYMLEHNSYAQTINRIKNEISVITHGDHTGNYMMFHHSDEAKRQYIKHDNLRYERGLISFAMIDYPNIYDKMKLLQKGWLKNYIQRLGYKDIEKASDKSLYGEYLSQGTHITSFIHYDVAKLNRLTKFYEVGYQYVNYKLLVICWRSMANALRKKIERPGKIEVISISEEDFSEEVKN
ncbi:hypothetical protein DH09_00410 (plasmid) [Bacillaceae bacterium JMAK1]|nr:hypothetical protein DH09_00410 [Bacillaceae bacterium JMAK1]